MKMRKKKQILLNKVANSNYRKCWDIVKDIMDINTLNYWQRMSRIPFSRKDALKAFSKVVTNVS